MLNTFRWLRLSLHGPKLILAGVSLIVCLPLTATVAANADSTCTPPTYTTGVHQPVGADASLYSYDCDTGLWESEYYSYDPATGVYAPLYQIVYTYDPTTGLYDYPNYVFDAPTNSYQLVTDTLSTPPSGATVVGGPTSDPDPSDGTSASDPSNTITDTGDGSTNTINDSNDPGGSNSISDTGADSNNTINASDDNNTNASDTSDVGVDNNLSATAISGDATVLANTTGGDATTGDATNEANIVNLLQSASDALGDNAVTFVANIDGNVNGDLLLDPSTLSDVQGSTDPSGNITVNNSDNSTLTNNVNLASATGNASVSENTNAGNATSGTASSVANVVNMIDSVISSGQSFLGVININGDLNGNILLPADFVDQLLADNVPTVNVITDTGASSDNTINSSSPSSTDITNSNNEGISNNIDSTATTGSADVSDNTDAGSATSGTANTSITAFNLTGSNVIGSNDLLVFVNVAGGSWVGLIINAPAGASAAEFGGGIIENTDGNTTVNNSNNEAITNNIDLAAASGDADVSYNTNAGSATSGNADDAANLLNIENSDLSLSGWFGILFINVFGTWNGSLGVYNPTTDPSTSSDPSGSSAGLPASFIAAPVFSFKPSSSGNSGGNYTDPSLSSTGNGSSNVDDAVLASIIKTAPDKSPVYPNSHDNNTSGFHYIWALIVGSIALYLLYWAGDMVYTRKHPKVKT